MANTARSLNVASSSEVGLPNVAAVRALAAASWALKRGAPSMRSKAISVPALSTTATVRATDSAAAAPTTCCTSRRAASRLRSLCGTTSIGAGSYGRGRNVAGTETHPFTAPTRS